jgi:RNA 3'-terminal phosphate cyclase (ATP)
VSDLRIDGSRGEGGGQIVRTALALAVTLGRSVVIRNIRANRPRPGLQPQHLAAVRALAAVGGARVHGAELGSRALEFRPTYLRGGDHRADVAELRGSAGSTTLILQALLLPLVHATAPSRLVLLGGTHVPWSPPFPYVHDVFLPVLRTLGVDASARLLRWGWYPVGGGEVEARVAPAPVLHPFSADEPPPLARIAGISAVSRLPRTIAERQARQARERLATAGVTATIDIVEDSSARSPGTFVGLFVPGRAGFSALGRRGVPAERIADEAVDALLAFRATRGAVDAHLADQLLPFLAMARGASRFTCEAISSHLRTVAWLLGKMLPVTIELADGPPACVRVTPHGTVAAGKPT